VADPVRVPGHVLDLDVVPVGAEALAHVLAQEDVARGPEEVRGHLDALAGRGAPLEALEEVAVVVERGSDCAGLLQRCKKNKNKKHLGI